MKKRRRKPRKKLTAVNALAILFALPLLWVAAGVAAPMISSEAIPPPPKVETVEGKVLTYSEAYRAWKEHEIGITVWCGPVGEPCSVVMSSVTGGLVELHVLCLDGMPCVGEEVEP